MSQQTHEHVPDISKDDLIAGDWFRCPDCGETNDDRLEVTLALGFKNSSIKVSCYNCGFVAKHRDPRSTNWRPGLSLLLKTKSAYHTHPVVNRQVLNAGQCPRCGSRTVSIELESVEHSTGPGEWDTETVLQFGAECLTCEFDYEYTMEHHKDNAH